MSPQIARRIWMIVILLALLFMGLFFAVGHLMVPAFSTSYSGWAGN